jgi:hypothetical protein
MGLLDVKASLVDWVWLLRGARQPEQEEVASISHLGQGDTAGAMRVKDEQHAGVSLRPARQP